MIRHGNGTPAALPHSISGRRKFNGHWKKLLPVPRAGQLRVDRTCSLPVSCLCAIVENVPGDGTGFLACARKPPRLPIPVAAVPTISLCPDSSGFGRPACVAQLLHPRFHVPPNLSRDDSQVRPGDKELDTSSAQYAFFP